jgi:hypothetical protein
MMQPGWFPGPTIPKFGQCITFSKADEEELVIYLVKLDSIRYELTYRDVVCQTNCEKDETVSVTACVSASGQYIPHFVVMKGQRYNYNYEIGMPSGTKSYFRKVAT